MVITKQSFYVKATNLFHEMVKMNFKFSVNCSGILKNQDVEKKKTKYSHVILTNVENITILIRAGKNTGHLRYH